MDGCVRGGMGDVCVLVGNVTLVVKGTDDGAGSVSCGGLRGGGRSCSSSREGDHFEEDEGMEEGGGVGCAKRLALVLW